MSSNGDEGFELFSSTRYDPALVNASWKPSSDEPHCPFLLLSFHLDRLQEAVRHFQWKDDIGIATGDPNIYRYIREQAEETVSKEENGSGTKPLRVRLVLSSRTGFRIECFPTVERPYDLLFLSTFQSTNTNPLPSSPFPKPTKVYLDTEPTPSSDFTSYKTTRRDHYNAARQRVGLTPSTVDGEVILFDEEGQITEGSTRNIALWRDARWVSPVGGGLKGVVRRWLLEQGRVVEGTIRKEDAKTGEIVLLTNGVEGCTLGIITDGKYE
ncbi:hypothetical protein Clacol_009298 [Clathrus columnatus]|uniref:Aminodeoxychorismate lyase n=1 Tax=Clathrus columnatus TaxID=1419009 RepID=A0AAV5ASZ6_9AGAM|nr:hypothetical protein Clacol_009298 [Clathrus columnatus]